MKPSSATVVKQDPQAASSNYRTGLCQHTLIELEACDPELLKRIPHVRRLLPQAVRDGGGTIVRSLFHEFSPWGVSGVVVITESHVTIHTWPEHRYAAIDIFSCSPKLDHDRIRRALIEGFKAAKSRTKSFQRGPQKTRRKRTGPAPPHKSGRRPAESE